ncbi:Hypothetical protein D9617_27g045430 [Elsinoe fawcettii]|nr:Hypothetical protein D9617_27g045430 [Elsinoe fawcettii]
MFDLPDPLYDVTDYLAFLDLLPAGIELSAFKRITVSLPFYPDVVSDLEAILKLLHYGRDLEGLEIEFRQPGHDTTWIAVRVNDAVEEMVMDGSWPSEDGYEGFDIAIEVWSEIDEELSDIAIFDFGPLWMRIQFPHAIKAVSVSNPRWVLSISNGEWDENLLDFEKERLQLLGIPQSEQGEVEER